jgi:hypothetical protein
VEENKNSTGISKFVGTAFRVRKGYPLFDRYGKKLTLPKEEQFLTSKIESEKKGLSGFGEFATPSKLIGPVLIANSS